MVYKNIKLENTYLFIVAREHYLTFSAACMGRPQTRHNVSAYITKTGDCDHLEYVIQEQNASRELSYF